MELPVAFAIAVGELTRPSAALFVLYTLVRRSPSIAIGR